MKITEEKLDEIIQVLEGRVRESTRFIDQYKKRELNDLVQYYEGANWAFNYALKILKEN